MTTINSTPSLGRVMCAAMGEAVGIKMVRDAKVSGRFDDVVEWTITFLPTSEQVEKLGRWLAENAADNKGR